jgi:hypothetical protein
MKHERCTLSYAVTVCSSDKEEAQQSSLTFERCTPKQVNSTIPMLLYSLCSVRVLLNRPRWRSCTYQGTLLYLKGMSKRTDR